jgi:hypothetical protein
MKDLSTEGSKLLPQADRPPIEPDSHESKTNEASGSQRAIPLGIGGAFTESGTLDHGSIRIRDAGGQTTAFRSHRLLEEVVASLNREFKANGRLRGGGIERRVFTLSDPTLKQQRTGGGDR